MNSQIVIFTDLDGTLLDHDSYSYDAAKPALDYIRKHNIPMIYTSSKTAIEIEQLCSQTNTLHPYIAENGGLLAIPKHYFSTDKQSSYQYTKTVIGVTRSDINLALNSLKNSYKFESFNEMTLDELMSHTGLTRQQVIYANQRDSTEPLLWLDEKKKLKVFAKQLEHYNLTLVSGGRFHHVMGKHDKATTMSSLIEQFATFYNKEITSVALGDSPNDLNMLKKATYGIVIPNPHAPNMCIDNHVNLSYAKHAGPQGWTDSLLTLLKELTE